MTIMLAAEHTGGAGLPIVAVCRIPGHSMGLPAGANTALIRTKYLPCMQKKYWSRQGYAVVRRVGGLYARSVFLRQSRDIRLATDTL
jgi:hypothetical protein